jgi:hypothetical protein
MQQNAAEKPHPICAQPPLTIPVGALQCDSVSFEALEAVVQPQVLLLTEFMPGVYLSLIGSVDGTSLTCQIWSQDGA